MKHDRRLSIRPSSATPQQYPAAYELSATDALFAQLDGQMIGERDANQVPWRAEVIAIHMAGAEAWVQIGPARQPDRAVVLRLPSPRQATLALRALEAWAALPEEVRPRMIDLSETVR